MPIVLFEHIINQQLKRIVPAKALRDYIDCFYVLDWRQPCLAFSDGIPTMAILADGEASVRMNGELLKGAWLSTEVLEQVQIEPVSHRGEILVVRFNPVTFHQLNNIDAIAAAAWAADTIAGKIKAIEALVYEKPNLNYLFEQALRLLDEEKGAMAIQSILAQLKVNYKWLERSFSAHMGLSPKAYARLQRFIHAYAALVKEGGHDLSAVAIHNGYYDQNHFIKEFRKFTGMSPLKYVKGRAMMTLF
ncbi:helix-turn-helix domain-containing protein [Chitinophaga sp.]|uniref:helix-turn-helix domain-containing protein n=1 Tax=Chitinophaga sp. TaxID=1869181 RepID=UPI0031E35FD0